jgi:indolepyruvate decarboxylase
MPMTADVGDCLFTAMEIENSALAAPGYHAGMGFGVPAGIGAAAATGRRPLVLVGDGAFQPESRFNDLDDWNFAAMPPHWAVMASGLRPDGISKRP